MLIPGVYVAYDIGLLIDCPTADAAALATFEVFAESRQLDEIPHPKFLAVWSEITERFPCLCELSTEDEALGVWTYGPLIDCFGKQIAQFSILFSAVDEVLPFLVKVCQRSGVALIDFQSGKVFRPKPFEIGIASEDDDRD